MVTNWPDVLPLQGVVGVLGKRGYGKSALAYHLAELRHDRLGAGAVVFGPSAAMQEQLPAWIQVVTDLDRFARARDKTLVLDEGSLPLHARESLRRDHVAFDKVISLSRQRKQVVIYVTHHSRKLDPLEVMDWDVVAFKLPSQMHVLMERPEMRLLSGRARSQLVEVRREEQKRWSYVFYDDLDQEALVENPLPTFWSEQLSIAVSLAQDEEEEAAGSAVSQEAELRSLFAQACNLTMRASPRERRELLTAWTFNQLGRAVDAVAAGRPMTMEERTALEASGGEFHELAQVVKQLRQVPCLTTALDV